MHDRKRERRRKKKKKEKRDDAPLFLWMMVPKRKDVPFPDAGVYIYIVRFFA
jgi:hypothetical protein